MAKMNALKRQNPNAKKPDVPVFMEDAETFLYLKYGENGKWAHLITWMIRKALERGTKKNQGIVTYLPYNGRFAKDLIVEVKVFNDFMKARKGFIVHCDYDPNPGRNKGRLYMEVSLDLRPMHACKYDSDSIRNTSPINYWGEKYGVEE